MHSEVLEIVNKKHSASRGKCGTYLTEIAQILNIELTELENILNKLKEEKKIVFRKGINGVLIMKK